jgi:fatty-acyl-CoA synthase
LVINTQKPPGAPANSIGLSPPGMDVAIIDPASSIECAPARFGVDGQLVNGHEAIGEIVGRNVVSSFEGYYKNAEAEADAERIRLG